MYFHSLSFFSLFSLPFISYPLSLSISVIPIRLLISFHFINTSSLYLYAYMQVILCQLFYILKKFPTNFCIQNYFAQNPIFYFIIIDSTSWGTLAKCMYCNYVGRSVSEWVGRFVWTVKFERPVVATTENSKTIPAAKW